jgi:biopolymer transport protein ExbD
MRFNQPQRRGDDVDINVTSFIDVLLLLLIFFMLTSTFATQSQIKLTLPTASKEAAEKLPATIEVAVDEKGVVYVAGRAVPGGDVSAIRDSLKEAVGKMDNPNLVIGADQHASYQSVIRVMDAARQLGLARITFRTDSQDAQ